MFTLRPLHFIFIFLNLLFIPFYGQTVAQKVAVVVPMQHRAMEEIVSGIQSSLKGQDVEILIKNAQGDPNIMFALFKQLKSQKIDILMPLGTSTCQMAISQFPQSPVLCVAGTVNAKISSFVTSINDEVPFTASLKKLPVLKNVAVFYSASEKIMPEVAALSDYASQQDIKLYSVMIQNLTELSAAVKSAPLDVQAFIILKDHLVVSGLNILIQEANRRYIPVLASDEGSVLEGATLAIGVKEKEIGTTAGLIAKDMLNYGLNQVIPPKNLEKMTVFVNERCFAAQKILSADDLKAVALPIVSITEKK